MSQYGRAGGEVFTKYFNGRPVDAFALVHAKGIAIYAGDGTPRKQISHTAGAKRYGYYSAVRSPGGWLWHDMTYHKLIDNPFGAGGDTVANQLVAGAPDGATIVVALNPEIVLVPDPVESTRPQRTTPGRRWADAVATTVTRNWKDPTPPGRRSVLPGPPTTATRFDERTGWRLQISLDGVPIEVPLVQGETQAQVNAKVRAAVTELRARYDPAAAKPGSGTTPAPPKGGKHDPHGPPPPDWWRPFDVHPSQAGGKGIANAPALPARVALKAQPDKPAPDVVAGSSYPFEMNVRWTDDLHGLASAMSYGYYWETLAASYADWNALAGIPDPTATGAEAATGVAGATPAPSAANQPTGSGKKVGRYESGTRKTQYTKRDASHDIASTWEDDRIAVAGETIAGGFKVATTWVVDVFTGVTEKDYNRSIKLDAPGYYLVRCTAWNTSATASSKFVRAASVDTRPVKVVDANRVAAAGAAEQLAEGGTTGAFGRYQQEVAAWERRLRGATLLAARRADPTKAVERLSSDDLAALARKPPSGKEPPTAQLTDDELQARTEMAVGGVTPPNTRNPPKSSSIDSPRRTTARR